MTKRRNFVTPATDIKAMLSISAEKFPASYAFKIKEKSEIKGVTFTQLKNDVEALGTELFSMGLKDTRIGFIGENSYPWFEAFLSVVCGGNVAVPFDKGFTSEELAMCIQRSKISALFYDKSKVKIVTGAVEILAAEGYPSGELKLFALNGETSRIGEMRAAGAVRLQRGETEYPEKEISREQTAVILFTSGTTSMSKAVILTHDNIMSNIRDMHNFEDLRSDDVNMAFLPLHHSFGLVGVLVFMACGACSVFCDGLKYITKNLAEYKVTVFVGVPLLVESMYKKIMQTVKKSGKEGKVNFGKKLSKVLLALGIDARRKLFKEIIDNLGGHLRLIISGAAPLAAEAGEGLNSFGIATIQGYGLTETSPVLCAERPDDLCPGSVGKPLPSVKIRIDNPDENGIGEIVASGPNVMAGYLDQPEATAEVIVDGWFHTGDLGRIDEKGNVWIMGRKKSVIVMKNGKNIFPEELEAMLSALPYVKDSMVFAREKHNELVLWVKIVYNEDYLHQENISEEQLAEQVKKDINAMNLITPKYKHINHFILDTEDMIKTTTQKVKRAPEIEKTNANRETERSYTV